MENKVVKLMIKLVDFNIFMDGVLGVLIFLALNLEFFES